MQYMCAEQRTRQVQKLKVMSNISLIKQEIAVSCRASAGAIPSWKQREEDPDGAGEVGHGCSQGVQPKS